MKQFCMMALAGLLVVGCQEVPKGYVINGEVENMPDGKIYLKSFRNKILLIYCQRRYDLRPSSNAALISAA